MKRPITSSTSKRWIPILNRLFEKYDRLIKRPGRNKQYWTNYSLCRYCSLCQATISDEDKDDVFHRCERCPLSPSPIFMGVPCVSTKGDLQYTNRKLYDLVTLANRFKANETGLAMAAEHRRQALKERLVSIGWKFDATYPYKVIKAPAEEDENEQKET